MYSRIGQNYYELHKLDAEACVQAEVEGITLAEKRIEEIKAQIVLVKGVESCPKCGCELLKELYFALNAEKEYLKYRLRNALKTW